MRSLSLCLMLAGAAAAQVYVDPFAYPDGTQIASWTEKRGDWIVQNGVVHTQTGSTWSYMTKDGFFLKDCVTEADVFYEGTSSVVQFGGTCARHLGGPNDTNLVMCKVQNNGGAADLDIIWTYEQGYGSASTVIGSTLAARIRMITIGNAAHTLVDVDRNGTWDVRHTKPLTMLLNPGEVGVTAFFFSPLIKSSGVDNFALFDAVLMADTNTPQVGTTVTLSLKGQNPGSAYQAACSLTTSPGIPVDSRNIPLTPDGLMIASLVLPSVFANFVGVLDANASGQAQIILPPSPPLVGLSFHTAFVTLNPASPSGVENISNDERFTIAP